VRPIRVRAPATTANVGPGFDCVGIALDLWNELEVTDGGDPDPEHLGVRAFALLAPPEGLAFRFTDRIPRERGLGSSAAVVALGLVAAAAYREQEPDLEELLALGTSLEGHPDNLAPALVGGATLTWDGRLTRVADTAPAVPIALIPEERVNTGESRAALPGTVPHRDAAFTAGRAAVLGAALASQDADLFAAALADRLHEPYRSPFLEEVRVALPREALGATLSGSGPTIMVWARPESAEACEDQLRATYPELDVLRLAVTPRGAASP
jgi:homoserine kinase